MNKKDIKKVVLAYSGGLDTTAIIPWLKENYDYDVICCCVDCGQGEELDGLHERAKASGASKLYIEDVTDEFCDDYIVPCVMAHAVYENKYLLGTSMARPVIAKRLVEIARKEGAVAICHGATGKGNDQIRFELSIKALAPDIKIIAPWRTWEFKSREDEIEYAEKMGIPLKINRETNYSKDKNLWHLSHEGLDLENPANEPKYDDPNFLELGVSPEQAPDKDTYITIHFEKGVPTAIDGVEMDGVSIVEKLNEVGGANGIGITDMIENRLVGMKSRGVYETPGGTILYYAHKKLEELTLEVMKKEGREGQLFATGKEDISEYVHSDENTVIVAVDEKDNLEGAAYITQGQKPFTYNDITKYFKYGEKYQKYVKSQYRNEQQYKKDLLDMYQTKLKAFKYAKNKILSERQEEKSFEEYLEKKFVSLSLVWRGKNA